MLNLILARGRILKQTQTSDSGVYKEENHVNKLVSHESIIYQNNLYGIQTHSIYNKESLPDIFKIHSLSINYHLFFW